jgi:Ras-related protein Rab-8A
MKEVQRLRDAPGPQPLRARSASMVAELPSAAAMRPRGRHGVPEPSDAPILKFLLVGDSGVGKSALLTRYVDDEFSPSFMTTIGIDFKSKHITLGSDECTRLRLQIWDTAGQERFRTITGAYYRGAMAVLLVYDVTSRESFARAADHWVAEVARRTEDTHPLLVLVGNKCDLATQRTVGALEGRNLAEARGYLFFETSACNGDGVAATFMEVAERVHRAVVYKPTLVVVESPVVTLVPDEEEAKKGTKQSCC